MYGKIKEILRYTHYYCMLDKVLVEGQCMCPTTEEKYKGLLIRACVMM